MYGIQYGYFTIAFIIGLTYSTSEVPPWGLKGAMSFYMSRSIVGRDPGQRKRAPSCGRYPLVFRVSALPRPPFPPLPADYVTASSLAFVLALPQ